MKKQLLPTLSLLLAVTAGSGAALLKRPPTTKPDGVARLAEGVYFRHGNLEERGHCNNGFVIFKDFVLVVDANFPDGVQACLADIRKVTDKPVRFVFDTHHHGDHAYGNPVWLESGAIPVAHEKVVGEMRRYEPGRWRESAAQRADVKKLGRDTPLPPIVTFPDRMVIDDGTRRVELLHFGTAHTRGDGFAYLPHEKILFSGDAVVNGPYNYMGDGNTESWLRVLDALSELDVELVAPGHGPCDDRTLIADQRAYIASLRQQVTGGIAAGKSLEELQESVKVAEKLGRYVGKMFREQIAKIYSEMVGLERPLELEELGFEEDPSTARDARWRKPEKIVISSRFFTERPRRVEEFRTLAPDVKIVLVPDPLDNPRPLQREIVDADALICSITSVDLVARALKLRWLHSISAGVEPYVGIGTSRTPGIPKLVDSDIILTNGKRCHGPNIADHVFAHVLAHTRYLKKTIDAKRVPVEGKSRWDSIDVLPREQAELRGKTMLIVGVGGVGGQVARRAEAFGMRVVGVDPRLGKPRSGVDVLRPPAALEKLLPQADVLVLSCPLTRQTRGLIGAEELALLPDSAYLINVSRGRVVDHDALVEALRQGKLAGAGLDVTEPEPLPDSSPLWSMENVTITPHVAAVSRGSHRRINLLIRENIRRFVRGEPLLNVVDKKRGY